MTEFLDMGRRVLLVQLATLIGAVALPVEALAKPRRRARRFLAAPQFALVNAVVDSMLPATDTPGALAAGVPARLDAMLLNWASAETRLKITGALDRIEVAARASRQRGFTALTAADRAAVLRTHDAGALQKVLAPAANNASQSGLSAIPVADPGYLRLKELTIHLYYFSEIGSASELLYEHVPGQFQPSIKLTPASRPYLGTGPF